MHIESLAGDAHLAAELFRGTRNRLLERLCINSAHNTSTHSTKGTPSKLPSPRKEKPVGTRCTGRPLVMMRVMPRMMPSVPSVTMKGAIRSRVVRRPFTNPQNNPVRMPRRMPTVIGMPRSIAMVPSTPLMARMAPTERSMPPAMMMAVIPSDMILMTAVCRTTLARLIGVRKCGDAMASATNRTIRLRNGSRRCIIRRPPGRARQSA